MSKTNKEYKKVTTNSLQEIKKNGSKISMLTAYDYTLAKIIDSAGCCRHAIWNISRKL